jgi:hypothetical protein
MKSKIAKVIGDVTIFCTPTALMEFPHNAPAEPSHRQMITDFAAGGHHPTIIGRWSEARASYPILVHRCMTSPRG